jgi:hypothetical protein
MIVHNGEYYPDVFLAGAPKSGTTFLFHPLSRHSQICASEPKEPDFHLDDENPNKKSVKNLLKKPYTDYFNDLTGEKLHLDGSQWTIYQTGLINEISTFEEKPKVLFILREPARRILSSFQYTSNNLSAVTDMSFSKYVHYLLHEDDGAIASHCRNVQAAYSLQHELKFSDYGYYLDKWEKAVGAENMKIFLFEEMKVNTEDCYKQVCQFLNLEEEAMQLDPDQMNKSVQIKNKSLHYVLHKAYGLVGYKVPFKSQIKRLYETVQHKQKNEAMDFGIDIDKLKKYYHPYNEKLAEHYQLDLAAWT